MKKMRTGPLLSALLLCVWLSDNVSGVRPSPDTQQARTRHGARSKEAPTRESPESAPCGGDCPIGFDTTDTEEQTFLEDLLRKDSPDELPTFPCPSQAPTITGLVGDITTEYIERLFPYKANTTAILAQNRRRLKGNVDKAKRRYPILYEVTSLSRFRQPRALKGSAHARQKQVLETLCETKGRRRELVNITIVDQLHNSLLAKGSCPLQIECEDEDAALFGGEVDEDVGSFTCPATPPVMAIPASTQFLTLPLPFLFSPPLTGPQHTADSMEAADSFAAGNFSFYPNSYGHMDVAFDEDEQALMVSCVTEGEDRPVDAQMWAIVIDDAGRSVDCLVHIDCPHVPAAAAEPALLTCPDLGTPLLALVGSSPYTYPVNHVLKGLPMSKRHPPQITPAHHVLPDEEGELVYDHDSMHFSLTCRRPSTEVQTVDVTVTRLLSEPSEEDESATCTVAVLCVAGGGGQVEQGSRGGGGSRNGPHPGMGGRLPWPSHNRRRP
ncbi:unnamed protein product [Vitrella brassicaformis CCMP3155]|uniref:Uncharacterized protein n=1 Tax=Vitrella brassicaformis (strain CCMP3155) TaxID=1169540 RepID=A0A0G4E8G8_VITBC|nr:unnamed protein product [Vitrella brassicaformis CCMP3155]|eukprot:CEL91618.1 unnamed protein product [Vitrella brassicaformis CCMP3155]